MPEKKHRQENDGRMGAVTSLLRGGVVGAGTAIVILFAASLLIWCGVIRHASGSGAAVLACALGAVAAGLTAAGKGSGGALFRGLGAGAVMFLLLFGVGAVIGDGLPPAQAMGAIPVACLCGGGAAALLRSGGRGRRRKKRGVGR